MCAKYGSLRLERWGIWCWVAVLALGWGCTTKGHEEASDGVRQQQIRKEQRKRQEAELSVLLIARSHHRRASVLFEQKQVERGLRELDAVLDLPIDRTFEAGQEAILDAWGRKASVLLRLGRGQQAEEVIQRALQRYGNETASFYLAQLYHIQGQILEQRKKLEAALVAYQRSIEINKEVIRRVQQARQGAGVLRPSTPQDATQRRQP
ncbi:tetratricopeptide repeat protein [Myxococcota bacterium]|nr:tetratricopeptide repeat protein [Myxococcota bacterium]